jgi:hypothetical protein
VGAQTLRAIRELFGNADESSYGPLGRDQAAAAGVWVLFSIPREARKADDLGAFKRALAGLGMSLTDDAFDSPASFIARVSDAVRDQARAQQTTTFTEMSILALRQTLTDATLKSPLPLFRSEPDEIRARWAEYGTNAGFSQLASSFFSNLLERSISFYLSKELPQQVGATARFDHFASTEAFVSDLRVWCRERASITDEFASVWLSKERFAHERSRGSDALDLQDARRFLTYALAKVGGEVAAHDQG